MKELKKIVYLGLVVFTVALMCLQAGAITTTRQTISKYPRIQKPTPRAKRYFS